MGCPSIVGPQYGHHSGNRLEHRRIYGNFNPYSPPYNANFHRIFHVRLQFILHDKGRLSWGPTYSCCIPITASHPPRELAECKLKGFRVGVQGLKGFRFRVRV